MITQRDIDNAVTWAKTYNIDGWVVRQILRQAGIEMPPKKQQVTITLDVEVPPGMALYRSNLTISEVNDIPVEIRWDESREGDCLVSN